MTLPPPPFSRRLLTLACWTLATAANVASAQSVTVPPCWRCQWPVGTTELTVALDWESFESVDAGSDAGCATRMRFTEVELEGLIQRGVDTWNRETGSSVRMVYVGPSTTPPTARVNIVAICTTQNFTGLVSEQGDPRICGFGWTPCTGTGAQPECDLIYGGAGIGTCVEGRCRRNSACSSNSQCAGGTSCVEGECQTQDHDTILELNFGAANFNYDGPWASGSTNDAQEMLTHELGHVLGLAHANQCDVSSVSLLQCTSNAHCSPPYTCSLGTCRYAGTGCSGPFGDSVVGNRANTLGLSEPNSNRHLWAWDTISIRHSSALGAPYAGRFRPRLITGTCDDAGAPRTFTVLNARPGGYGVTTARRIDAKRSSAASNPRLWWPSVTNYDTSNAAPVAAWGFGDYTGTSTVPSWCSSGAPNCPQFVVAFAATTSGGNSLGSSLYTRVASGYGWGGAGLGGPAPGGARTNIKPALAYGDPASDHLWVMVHQAADDSRVLWQQTSDDGVAWTTPGLLTDGTANFSTHHAPALAYSANAGQFVLLWADRTTDLLRMAWSDRPDLSTTWDGTVVTIKGLFRAQSGLAVACDPASNDCLIAFNTDYTSGDQTVWAWRRANIRWSAGAFAITGTTYTYSGEQARNELGLTYSSSTADFLFAIPRGTSSINHRIDSRDLTSVTASTTVSNASTTGEYTSDGVSAATNDSSNEIVLFYLANP